MNERRDGGAFEEDVPQTYGDDLDDGGDVRDLKIVRSAQMQVELLNFAAIAEMAAKIVPATIKATRPGDWLAMGSADTPAAERKVYLQGPGLDRIMPLWGIVTGRTTCTREDYPDGTFAYVFAGPMKSTRTGVTLLNVEGGRWSGDDFFRRFEWVVTGRDETGKEIRERRLLPVDPLEVRKSGFQNWLCRGVAILGGLRGLTVADLERYGITGVKGISFDSGGKGGGGGKAGKVEKTPNFGPAALTAIADLSDAHLAFYSNASRKNIEDPKKVEYHAIEKKRLQAYEAEASRRAEAAGETGEQAAAGKRKTAGA
jgi:hypothetical protein